MESDGQNVMTYNEFPSYFSASLGAFLMIENIFGLTFNLMVLVVYHLSRRSLTSVGNIIITSLSILDLLVGLTTIPLTFTIMVTSRMQSRLFCYFHEASISFASSASAINLMMISLDRYDTIITPLNRKLTMNNVKYVLIFIWVISLVGFCTPFFGYEASGTRDERSITGNLSELPCFEWFNISRKNKYFYELYYVILYIISNTVMIYCYFRIFHEAKSRLSFRTALVKATFLNIPGARTENSSVQASKAHERRMTKMTMMIVSTFMICWGPHAILSVVMVILDSTLLLEQLQLWFLALAYFSTVLHPLLYAFMRQNFRQVLTDRWRSRRSTIRVSPVTDEVKQISMISPLNATRDDSHASYHHNGRSVSVVANNHKVDTPPTVISTTSRVTTISKHQRSISQIVDRDSHCNFVPSNGSMDSLIRIGGYTGSGSLAASLGESMTGQYVVINSENIDNLPSNLRPYVIEETSYTKTEDSQDETGMTRVESS
ncbi:G-protein coupled receptor 22-like [Lineus longissimus]|uniref:G-protein coupled receptor 22-like n=1 Tax=Lineus longissimus TaxID=88925 RepID=UPI002B4EA05F